MAPVAKKLSSACGNRAESPAFSFPAGTLFVISAVLLGCFLRILNFVQDKSLWGDEFFTLWLFPMNYSQALSAILRDVHAPLYYFSLRFWMDLFGASPLSLRAPSLLASLFFIPVFVYFSGVVSGYDKKTMGMAAIFTSISPYFLQLSNEAREYSIASLLGVLVLLFFFRYLFERKAADGWFFGLFMLLGLYLHHYFWPLFLLLLIYFGWRTRAWAAVCKLAVPIFLLSLPMLYCVIWQMRFSEGTFDISRIIPTFQPVSLAKTFFGQILQFGSGYYLSHISIQELTGLITHDLFGLLLILLVPLMVLVSFLFVFFSADPGRREVRQAGILFLILYIALTFVYPIRAKARYFAEFAPLFYLVVSSGLALGWQKKWSRIFVLLFFVLNLGSSLYAVGIPTDPIHREDHRAITSFLSNNLTSNDLVIGSRYSVEFYAAKERIKLDFDHVLDDPKSIEDFLSKKTYRRIFVIFYGDKEPSANEAYKRSKSEQLSKYGYSPTGEELRFGGRLGFHYGFFYEHRPELLKTES